MYRSGVTVHSRLAGAWSSALAKVCGVPMGAVIRVSGVASTSSWPLVNLTVPVRMKKLSSCSRWRCCGGPDQPGASVHSTSPQRPSTAVPSARTRKPAPPTLQLSPAPARLTVMVICPPRWPGPGDQAPPSLARHRPAESSLQVGTLGRRPVSDVLAAPAGARRDGEGAGLVQVPNARLVAGAPPEGE